MSEKQPDHSHPPKPSPDPDSAKLGTAHSSDYSSYPKLDPNDIAPPPENWANLTAADRAPISGTSATSMPPESNPYVTPSPAPQSSVNNKMDTVKDVLGKWGKKAAEKAKKTEDLAGNMWQHLKTGPSLADAAVSRIAQGTKVLAEGGYDKVFRQSFDTVPDEQLLKSFACYLSTSSGPVMGTLYLSTVKLAFCSDNALQYKVGDKTEWSYYKVVIPRVNLKVVNPSTSRTNKGEKYIQVISIDNHEFWFMGLVHYDSAVKHLQEAVVPPNSL